MFELLIVFLGGSIGATLRYLLSEFAFNFDTAFMGTLIINIVGCLFLGFVTYLALKMEDNFNSNLKLFLTTGIAGGFTTLSTFNLELFKLFQSNQILTGFAYIFSSVCLSFSAIIIGMAMAKGLHSFVIQPIFAYQEEDIELEESEMELAGSVND